MGARRQAGADPVGRPAPPHRPCPGRAGRRHAVATRRAPERARRTGAGSLSHGPCKTPGRRRPRHRRHARRSWRCGGAHFGADVSGFAALVARDLRLVWRRPGDVAVVLAFFVVATTLFPLGIGPETNVLARIAPGVLWCAALFAALLSLDRLFAADFEDGTLDLLLLAPWSLELAALAKCCAHWIVTGLPLALLAPLMGMLFGLSA